MISRNHKDTITGKKRDMISMAMLAGFLVLGILMTGCTQSYGTRPETTVIPAASPTPSETVSLAATETHATAVPAIRYISQMKDLKDQELLFMLQVPVEWNVTTRRLDDTSDTGALMYQTDLLKDKKFTIRTYSISHSQDQAFRDEFRAWSPAPAETKVEINDIIYDRFESASGDRTQVAYVARKTSANERGYASVLFFTTNTSNRFEKEDYEKVVSSFRYMSGNNAKTAVGEEIPKYSLSGESLNPEPVLPVMDNSTGLCRCKLAG